MRLSVNACIHNLPCFGLLAVMLYVLIWLAMLPAGLGMLACVAAALYYGDGGAAPFAHLRSPAEQARRFARWPIAVTCSLAPELF